MAKAIGDAKTCSTCRVRMTLAGFHKNRSQSDGLHSSCKACVSVQNRAWRQANPEKKRAQRRSGEYEKYYRKHDLKRKYGLTLEQYAEMFNAQGGVCAICDGASDRHLSVDHDHATGLVRGLLCSACNLGLGNFRDDTSFLTAAINYLS